MSNSITINDTRRFGYTDITKDLTIKYNGREVKVWVSKQVADAIANKELQNEQIAAAIFGAPSDHKKIVLTTVERIRNFICCLFSLGLYGLYYQIKFQESLIDNYIKEAIDAIKHGARPYLTEKTIIEITRETNNCNSLCFFAAQLDVRKNKAAIEQFIAARDSDDSSIGDYAKKRLVQALPYGRVPLTAIYKVDTDYQIINGEEFPMDSKNVRDEAPLGLQHLKMFAP